MQFSQISKNRLIFWKIHGIIEIFIINILLKIKKTHAVQTVCVFFLLKFKKTKKAARFLGRLGFTFINYEALYITTGLATSVAVASAVVFVFL